MGCMRQVLGPGALGRPRGIGWRGRWEGGLGWGLHVTPWLIHVNVWQNPLQCCEIISLQLIKINEKRNPPRARYSHAHIRSAWSMFVEWLSSPPYQHCLFKKCSCDIFSTPAAIPRKLEFPLDRHAVQHPFYVLSFVVGTYWKVEISF